MVESEDSDDDLSSSGEQEEQQDSCEEADANDDVRQARTTKSIC